MTLQVFIQRVHALHMGIRLGTYDHNMEVSRLNELRPYASNYLLHLSGDLRQRYADLCKWIDGEDRAAFRRLRGYR